MQESVQTLLRRVVETGCAYYQLAVLDAGGPEEDVLARLPPTRRADLIQDQLTHPPYGTRRRYGAPAPVRAGSVGHNDDLLVLTWTASDLECERAAGVRLLRQLGVEPAMRVANTLAGALVTPGSLLLGDVIDELGALDVPLGSIDSDAAAQQAWDLVDHIEANVLVLDPSTADRLLAAAPPAARSWLKGIVWLQMVSLPPASEVPANVGFSGWQRRWLAVPEARSFLASECSAGRLHVDADINVEIADDAGAPVSSGSQGKLLATPLSGDAPLLRFDTGMWARLGSNRCACASPTLTLELC